MVGHGMLAVSARRGISRPSNPPSNQEIISLSSSTKPLPVCLATLGDLVFFGKNGIENTKIGLRIIFWIKSRTAHLFSRCVHPSNVTERVVNRWSQNFTVERSNEPIEFVGMDQRYFRRKIMIFPQKGNTKLLIFIGFEPSSPISLQISEFRRGIWKLRNYTTVAARSQSVRFECQRATKHASLCKKWIHARWNLLHNRGNRWGKQTWNLTAWNRIEIPPKSILRKNRSKYCTPKWILIHLKPTTWL